MAGADLPEQAIRFGLLDEIWIHLVPVLLGEGKHQQDLEAIARAIIDANQYMTLGTVDEAGRPWVSPVWYALAQYRKSSGSHPQRRRIRATSWRARS